MLYGLIFDVDGVIADTEAVNATATIKAFADLFGVRNVRRRDFESGLGRGAEEYVKAAACVHDVQLTDRQLAAATGARQHNFLQLLKEKPLAPFPGVLELINDSLARQDFRLAIATSSTREKSEAVLRSAGIPYQQMIYVTASDVKIKKPEPDIFLKACKRMRLASRRCLVIEDAPDGVQAARAAGCRCLAVTNSTSVEKLSRADVIVTSLNEVSVPSLAAIIDSDSASSRAPAEGPLNRK